MKKFNDVVSVVLYREEWEALVRALRMPHANYQLGRQGWGAVMGIEGTLAGCYDTEEGMRQHHCFLENANVAVKPGLPGAPEDPYSALHRGEGFVCAGGLALPQTPGKSNPAAPPASNAV